ncbi:MAG: monofunctional biosynthetic peptidoglycan transglycosylase [Roseivivax sp.]|nr:monofunctional biosynthetic peptidoglycan transglycosylase [Roseivivax sp.]
MASEQTTRKKRAQKSREARASGGLSVFGWLRRWLWRAVLALAALLLAWIVLYSIIAPPTTLYILGEQSRLGRPVDRVWVPADQIAPVMLRSAVAAEDANFCEHWGFDMRALRIAIEAGGNRGASTISQQVVKNVYLWHGRTYTRKALEAVITPAVEAVWTKRRILEVYLNVAEFDEGVFGVEAAARHYFNTSAAKLSAGQAAQLAAVLPAPKERSAAKPTGAMRKRAAQIADGAATIERDGRSACFE